METFGYRTVTRVAVMEVAFSDDKSQHTVGRKEPWAIRT
jgi:hypothetical protein